MTFYCPRCKKSRHGLTCQVCTGSQGEIDALHRLLKSVQANAEAAATYIEDDEPDLAHSKVEEVIYSIKEAFAPEAWRDDP